MDIQIAKKLIVSTLPLMTSYKKDLLFHDMNFLKENPGVKFIHFTRETGTAIEGLWPAEKYPAAGKSVAYLFGTATREHILSQLLAVVEYFTKNECEKILYYNGKTLRSITIQRAFDIVREYTNNIKYHWKRAA